MKSEKQRAKDERDLAIAEKHIASTKRGMASLPQADQHRYAETIALLEQQIAKLRASLRTEA